MILNKIVWTNDEVAQKNTPATTPHPILATVTTTEKDVREDGQLIRVTRRQVVIPAAALPSGVVPTTTDTLTINGQESSILAIEESAPAGTVIRYLAEVEA